MGNSGVRKLLSPLDYVETKHNSCGEIDVLTLDKQLVKLPVSHYRNIVFLHYRSLLPQAVLDRLKQINAKESLVVLLPDGDCPDSFEDLKQRYPESYAKMDINGDAMHPLFKYLKRNCGSFYEPYGMGSKRIQQTVGAFLVNRTSDQSQEVRYFRQAELTGLLAGLPSTNPV